MIGAWACVTSIDTCHGRASLLCWGLTGDGIILHRMVSKGLTEMTTVE